MSKDIKQSYIQRGKKISLTKRNPMQKVIEGIIGFDCKYISGEYVNNKSKLLILFPCGHSNQISYASLQNGTRCKVCSRIKQDLDSRVPIEKIMDMLKRNSLSFVSFPDGYKNQKSRIIYTCQFGHKTDCSLAVFYRKNNCQTCTKIKQYLNRRGSKHPNWKGGLEDIFNSVKKNITEWKKESAKACDYRCVVSGNRFDVIHHLYGFNMILRESISNLGLLEKESIGKYSDKEIIEITNETIRLHNKYPLGVCLTKEIHSLFHKMCGSGNNTPEQFYEFQRKIKSGEIIIPES